ncbi:MAG: hypothetical protein R2713_10485 [Ilumatobacteraceae bacterium]
MFNGVTALAWNFGNDAVGIIGKSGLASDGFRRRVWWLDLRRPDPWREGIAPARPSGPLAVECRIDRQELVCEAVSGGGSNLWCTVTNGATPAPQARRPGHRRASCTDRSRLGVRLTARRSTAEA